jgi:hypothetical protein
LGEWQEVFADLALAVFEEYEKVQNFALHRFGSRLDFVDEGLGEGAHGRCFVLKERVKKLRIVEMRVGILSEASVMAIGRAEHFFDLMGFF